MTTNKGITKEERFLIDGSGLFFFNSDLSDTVKLEIVKWYNNLSGVDKNYVDILRNESTDEADFFSDED